MIDRIIERLGFWAKMWLCVFIAGGGFIAAIHCFIFALEWML